MAGASLLTLLDDIAAVLDDVAVMTFVLKKVHVAFHHSSEVVPGPIKRPPRTFLIRDD